MNVNGKYQVSFLCSDADQLLQDLEYYIINGNKLNEYSKFALRNTDNFYDLEEILKEIEINETKVLQKQSLGTKF
ncbi:hypothetical protein [Campylobacter sp. US33a]|uniref:hypothetical protein n=1 Tax=Campylobacter sp. US33a TaxID=2498120 RepID=UPI001067E364|nr:hypothetical protein [Campylobacter sp. US33a]TEY00701.1 hypothetical protein ELQ16_08685 [Campylobacter sp. US33a]